jgi:hypothetical protein
MDGHAHEVLKPGCGWDWSTFRIGYSCHGWWMLFYLLSWKLSFLKHKTPIRGLRTYVHYTDFRASSLGSLAYICTFLSLDYSPHSRVILSIIPRNLAVAVHTIVSYGGDGDLGLPSVTLL